MSEILERTLPPLSPHLVVSDGAAAIDFYKAAFGAVELRRMAAPDGRRVLHAALDIGGSTVMLADDFPEYRGGKSTTPEALGGTPVTLHLQVEDADIVFSQAVEAGAVVTMPLKDQFWGDRYGQLRDPFGHMWSVGAAVRR